MVELRSQRRLTFPVCEVRFQEEVVVKS